MKHIIIGTAGHVDHGKTALIRALTGTDTDRLKEEKARGISIDLGFAALRLNDDTTAGIVDVPGHERFLKNMLAGTGGIDMVMLVIAADEGVMPQTREHLAMLGLYGVRYGVVVLNKADKVDNDWMELVEEDVRGLLSDTFLAQAPVCRVSAVTGAGLPELRQTLLAVAGKVPARDTKAPFRLWIDRAFIVKGHGTVVTGSALSGTVAVGDTLKVYPGGVTVKVRGLESHGQKAESVSAGQRTAINLSGADTEVLERGMELSAPARGMTATTWDVIADWQEDVPAGTRIRLHLGTAEVLGRLHYYKDLPPKFSRLILEEPLGAGFGDRGIVRLYSPQHLLGGVTLLAPAKPSRRLSPRRLQLAEALEKHNNQEIIGKVIADHGQPIALEDIKRAAGYLPDRLVDEVIESLKKDGVVMVLGNFYLTSAMEADLVKRLVELVAKYHKEQPDRPGLSKEIARQKLDLKERAYEVLLDYWQKKGAIVIAGADLALREFASKHGDWRQNLVDRAEEAFRDIGLTSVDPPLLAEKLGLPADKARAALDILLKEGALSRVGDMVLAKATIEHVAKLVRKHFATNPTISVGELRDMLETSRKVALPLIEFFDQQKYTVRDGDARKAGPRLPDKSE